MTIPELTARIEALEASEADAKAKLTTATADLAAAQSLADEVQAKLTAEELKSAELATKLATAESDSAIAKSAAALAAKDLALAREQSARFGTTAPAKTDAGQHSEKQLLTQAQFNALSPKQRMEYVKGGGKLTD